MKLIKYDRAKEGTLSTTIINNGNSNGSNYNTSTRGDDRNIWGQYDGGSDIDGSMTVNGTINIKAIIPPQYAPDIEDDVDGDDIEEETGGGNLNVELTITSNKVDANEVFAKNHLYVNYPHPTGTKQCVVDLIKSNADGISSNLIKINKLTSTVNNNTSEINGLKTTVRNNTTNISNNSNEIIEIKKRINEGVGVTENRVMEILNEWKYGNANRPVILLSGKISRTTTTGSTAWEWYGSMLNCISSISIIHNGGMMTISLNDATNFSNYIYAVHVNQSKSGDTGEYVSNTTVSGRGDGAHWFETRWDNKYKRVYIREFHQSDANSDAWESNSWSGDGGGIKEISITIIGYAFKKSTTAEASLLNDTQNDIIDINTVSEMTEPETEKNEIN